jgi:ATP-dependent 26S proteasome regulatory subunit
MVEPENMELFNFLKKAVFESDIESDDKKYNLLQLINLEDEKKDSTSTPNQLEEWFNVKNIKNGKTCDTQEVNINYYGDSLLKAKKSYSIFNESKRKLFKYNEYVVQFLYRISDKEKMSDIRIDLIRIDNTTVIEKLTTPEYIAIIENFLEDTLKISKKMEYVYKITISNQHVTTKLSTLFNHVDAVGLIKIGDGIDTITNQKEDTRKFVGNKLLMKMKCSTLSNNVKDNSDQIEIFENKQNYDINELSATGLHKKYVSLNGERFGGGAFYIKDNKIILIYICGSSYNICIVSTGQMLSNKDIVSTINQTINYSNELSNKSKIVTVKNNVYISRYLNKRWTNTLLDKRSFDTIYLPSKMLAEIKSEIVKFILMEKIYREYQIPYKKGILFYGPPGTGKTSLVKSLAFEYQLNIFIINVNDENINDDTIVDILNSLGGGNKILLFEDIDTAFSQKEKVKNESRTEDDDVPDNADVADMKEDDDSADEDDEKEAKKPKTKAKQFTLLDKQTEKKKKFLTYSGLLNALDGALSNHHGVITIMTTNYIEKLGPAFIRQGRIDRKFELKECNHEQIYTMAKTFITKKIKIMRDTEKPSEALPTGAPTWDDRYPDEYDDGYGGACDVYGNPIPRSTLQDQGQHTRDEIVNNIKRTLDITNDDKYTNDEYLEEKLKAFTKRVTNQEGMSNIKPCELQYYLIKNIENIDDIFNNVEGLLNKTDF